MRYQAKPVIVDAFRIVGMQYPLEGGTLLSLENGKLFTASKEMTARMTPAIGDFVVWQEDGYAYLNRKAVFERKYAPLPEAS